jgi:BirA family transcriptional regulator, biotin operon repressor / biotin---[acetyl-CoA-carboxylase] ligase
MTGQDNENVGTWPFVRTMVILDEVDSTNDLAAQLVHVGSIELPLGVWAARQTRGRGRGTHSWWSDSGGLTFTVAIDPAAHGVQGESEPKLALATAVAVINALVELGFDSPALGIRWPNDVEVDGRKLCGILPEVVDTPHGRRLLIGVGINVLTDPAEMPGEIRRMATSLSAIQRDRVEAGILPRLLAAILEQFGSVVDRLVRKDTGLVERWNALDLLREEWVSVDLGSQTIAGHGCGIDEDGALCLDDGSARHRVFGGRVLR